MLDPKLLRSNLEEVEKKLRKKGYTLNHSEYLELEEKRKILQTSTQELQNARNAASKEIGQFKKEGNDTTEIFKKVAAIGENLKTQEQELHDVQEKLQNFLLSMPNIPAESVPEGRSEEDNELVKTVGNFPKYDFEIRDHVAIGELIAGLDLNRATKLSGSRFAVLYKDLAKLHRALIQFMLDNNTKHGYSEVYVPYLVKEECLYGTGALPKMREDLFKIEGEKDLYLIPTAEVPLTNLYREEIIDSKDLPIKLCAHSPCFRSEAGSYGKDTKGLIRQHQFEKIELFQITRPDESYEKLEELVSHAEDLLQLLELPYRIVNLCGGDLSFSSAKTFDLEVFLPSQQCYREISSCSNFADFQARRAKIRFRDEAGGKPILAHTINGSALAVGRTLVAILDNHQNSDGSVNIPKVLRPYLNGLAKLEIA
ncbi:MAG: serine--tRNA ligase [Alphaproteobacteria bacterium]|jgi:seryl-tRNA synthetase|nr:serine--tRNA ligase [Alphaproteobacteria bacterium]